MTPRPPRGSIGLELLLTLATIGLLLLLALRVYPELPRRAQMTEGIGLAGAMRGELALAYAYHGRWPDIEAFARHTQFKTEGKYTRHLSVDEGGVIRVAMDWPQDLPNTLTLRPALSTTRPPMTLAWACGSARAPAGFQAVGEVDPRTQIEPRYLPTVCR